MKGELSGALITIIIIIAVLMVIFVIMNKNTAEASSENNKFIASFQPGILKGTVALPQINCKVNGGAYSYVIDVRGVTMSSSEDSINFLAFAEFAGPATGYSMTALSTSPDSWAKDDSSFAYGKGNTATNMYAVKAFDPKKIETLKTFMRVSLWRDSICIKDNFDIEKGTHTVKNKDSKDAGEVDVLNKCAPSYLSSFDVPGTVINNYACNSQLCTTYNANECNNNIVTFGLCYYSSGIGSQCKGCPDVKDCTVLSQDECQTCTVSENTCSWTGSWCIGPTKANSIDVKIDPGKSPIEIDEFGFSDNGVTGKCMVRATNKETALLDILKQDVSAAWFVSPGGKIKTSGSLCSGLLAKCGAFKDYVTSPDVITAGAKKASPDPSDSNEAVGGAAYTEAVNDKCDGKCGLLAEKNGKHIWQPRAEILCTDGGLWAACDGAKTVQAEGNSYVCTGGVWTKQSGGESTD